MLHRVSRPLHYFVPEKRCCDPPYNLKLGLTQFKSQCYELIYLDKLEFIFLRRLDNLSKYRILLRVSDKITTQYVFRFCFGKEYPSVYTFYLMTFSSTLSTKYVIEG